MTDRPTTEEARPRPNSVEELRLALERVLAVAMTEEEDVSPATQDEWIAAIKQANEALALPPEQGEPPDPEPQGMYRLEPRTVEMTFAGHVTSWRLGDDAKVEDSFVGPIQGRIVGLSWRWHPDRTIVIVDEDGES